MNPGDNALTLGRKLIARSITTIALLLAAPATAQMQGGAPLSIGESYLINSETLGGERIVTVRLPAEYDADPEARFPVVYLLDGGPEQDFAHIAGIAQSREMNGTFAPFILVGIQSTDRRHFFTPPAADVAAYEEALAATPGGSATYREFLRYELKPLVEASFRTNGRSAVIGESLGGLFVVETLLRDPTLFDDYIAISPSMWWEAMQFGREAAGYLDAMPAGERRLYLTVANEGFWHREGMERLVDALRDHAHDDLQWTYVPVGDSETHASIFHPMALDAFRTLYGTPWREYQPDYLISGMTPHERTPAEQARVDEECTRANSRPTTPEATSEGRERLYYECLLLDLGPRAREGTLRN